MPPLVRQQLWREIPTYVGVLVAVLVTVLA